MEGTKKSDDAKPFESERLGKPAEDQRNSAEEEFKRPQEELE